MINYRVRLMYHRVHKYFHVYVSAYYVSEVWHCEAIHLFVVDCWEKSIVTRDGIGVEDD
jgi:hypothetical protein